MPEGGAKSFDSDRPDLLRLGLGRDTKPANFCRYEDLEREHVLRVASERYDRHHAPTEALGTDVGVVVAYYHSGPPLVGLATTRRVEVHKANVPPAHQGRPSPVAASQASRSVEWSHSSHAAT